MKARRRAGNSIVCVIEEPIDRHRSRANQREVHKVIVEWEGSFNLLPESENYVLPLAQQLLYDFFGISHYTRKVSTADSP